jgi:flagellar hook-basal body complex protein FliE
MAIKELGAAAGLPPIAEPMKPSAGAKADFGSYLKNAVGEVNDLQQMADKAIQSLVADGKGDLQDTMVALEKADISFRFMMQVRNKVLEAYQEIIRMQV